ncbi:MAG: TIGR00282 family metallophosphoesterase [Candidatus Omnitrophica bacterium]|nr:TIGR00282 family metallophosphoesterase [Candidatus Omnitrophota bacterium]
MNVLCIGDIVGKPGRDALAGLLPDLKKRYSVDFTVVNAENAAHGAGLTTKIAKDFFNLGCDVLTLGDHVWDQKDLEEYLNENHSVIRPANFPQGAPGVGWCIKETAAGIKVGVVNLLGRVFMRHFVECPFKALETIVREIAKETPNIIVDFHAEATSEKVALGHFMNGKVSAIVGTHTHIQTADEKVLSDGTAYITDLGMSGPYDSVIGQDKDIIIERFVTALPKRFFVAKDETKLHGVIIEVDEATGKSKKIQRVQENFVVD